MDPVAHRGLVAPVAVIPFASKKCGVLCGRPPVTSHSYCFSQTSAHSAVSLLPFQSQQNDPPTLDWGQQGLWKCAGWSPTSPDPTVHGTGSVCPSLEGPLGIFQRAVSHLQEQSGTVPANTHFPGHPSQVQAGGCSRWAGLGGAVASADTKPTLPV